jgi:outer membrane protein assembly factor BamB
MGWSQFRKVGLTHHEPVRSVKGYTLITPLGGNASYLIDMSGQIVHRWLPDGYNIVYGRLQPNGHLLAHTLPAGMAENVGPGDGMSLPFEQRLRTLGGNAMHLTEFDWDGNVVWQYENPAIHHDFVCLPNGHTLMPETVELPPDVSKAVRGGLKTPRGQKEVMLSDDVIEIDAKGKLVKRHHVWKLLDPVKDPLCPIEDRGDWTHVNGLDATAEGDIVFSCRNNSRLGRIDARTGELTWKFGQPVTSHQHHPTVLPNGNLQIFDNGQHASRGTRSRIIEVDFKDSSIVWEYTGSPAQQFFSSHISGAQRLAGDNVLICEGASGRIFEVTRNGETVWEWQNPFIVPRRGQPLCQVFRAHRYGLDDPAVAGHELDPGRYRELNRANGLVE